jgi:hypothetical protein
MTPMGFFVKFCEGQFLRSPLPTTLHKQKARIREACAHSDQEILQTCGRRLNIGLMLLVALVVLTLNFINDKLLFIKLFQLVF